MEKKSKRKTASFSFNEETIRKFESYCNKKRINRSRLVEDLVIEFLNGKHTVSQSKETPDATVSETH